MASVVKERYEKLLLEVEGVVGAGIGLSETEGDKVVIQIYVEKAVGDVLA